MCVGILNYFVFLFLVFNIAFWAHVFVVWALLRGLTIFDFLLLTRFFFYDFLRQMPRS